jgi:hypothetical protein
MHDPRNLMLTAQPAQAHLVRLDVGQEGRLVQPWLVLGRNQRCGGQPERLVQVRQVTHFFFLCAGSARSWTALKLSIYMFGASHKQIPYNTACSL